MSDPINGVPSTPTTATGPTGTTGTHAARSTPTTQPVDIAALQERYGWSDGGWQDRLLESADAQGGGDGKVTAAEVDAYLANPLDGQFLSSERIVEQRNVLAGAGGSAAVDEFQPGWQQTVAQSADRLGKADGQVTAEELEHYIDQLRTEKGAFPSWFPDQKAAAFHSKIADVTGEADALRAGKDSRPVSAVGAPVTDSASGVQIIKDYMRLSVDNNTRNPEWVSYVMSAADLQVQEEVKRPSIGFHLDPEMPNKPVPRVTDGEYTLLNKARKNDLSATPFDRGHMREAESSVNAEAMYESFQTNNISPQYGALNQGAWRYLEEATRELAVSNEGKVTVFTGNLYLDDNGKPLLPEEIDRQATTRGHDGLAIPTHCFKTILLEKPDGQKQMFAYLVPNNPEMKTDIADVQSRLGGEDWRVSVDQIERLIGKDLYSHLDSRTQNSLERNTTARAAFVSQTQFKMANLFMGDGTYRLASN